MQLNNNTKIAAAAGSVLGALHPVTAIAEQADWRYDITGFQYTETDNRIEDSALKLQATRTTESGSILNAGLGYDSLTGASAGGQVALDGSGSPVLTPVEDQRISGNLSLTQPMTGNLEATAGASFSNEDDYQHLGFNVGLARAFNNKNTTFNASYAYSADTVEGVTGNPVPLTFTGNGSRLGEQDKNVNDFIIGFTQVLSKNSIALLNYSLSYYDGYLNDPYKVVSIIDAGGIPQAFIYESRPSSRTGQALYGALNVKTAAGIFKPSYRFFSDDWGITSNTFDIKYALALGNSRTLEPHLRLYSQNRADFYRGQLPINSSIPGLISSDYRLDEFNAITLGLQYRWLDNHQNTWRIGLDYYTQSPGDNPDQLPGQNALNPGITAFMLRLGVTF